jgi:hypothetical protein
VDAASLDEALADSDPVEQVGLSWSPTGIRISRKGANPNRDAAGVRCSAARDSLRFVKGKTGMEIVCIIEPFYTQSASHFTAPASE